MANMSPPALLGNMTFVDLIIISLLLPLLLFLRILLQACLTQLEVPDNLFAFMTFAQHEERWHIRYRGSQRKLIDTCLETSNLNRVFVEIYINIWLWNWSKLIIFLLSQILAYFDVLESCHSFQVTFVDNLLQSMPKLIRKNLYEGMRKFVVQLYGSTKKILRE